ncbi:MAG TPA: sulfotransferase, partial [Sphingomonadales bacterium]|nr:sulfotransferase [Sphingomonadales bacterium]
MNVRKIRQANRLRARGNPDAAVEAYKSILREDVNNPGGLVGLAGIAAENQNLDAAREILLRALQAGAKRANVWARLGGILRELNDLTGAERALQKALDINPDFAPAYQQLGLAALAKGETEAAASFFEKSLKSDPLLDTSFVLLAAVKVLRPEEEAVAAMREALRNPKLPPRRKSNVHFALARVSERLGDTKAFFAHLEDAHRLLVEKTPQWREALEAERTAICGMATPEYLSAQVGDSFKKRTPIFLIGMPRAGVGLMGRILAAHPSVAEGAHIPFFHHYLRRATQTRCRKNFPAGASELSIGDVEEIARAYQARMESYGPEKAFFTDTAPETFKTVGMIFKAMPWAKVIHIRRDAADCAFSNYRNPPRPGQSFANDFDALGFYASRHDQWMAFWKEAIPGFVHEVLYEELTVKPESEIRRVLDFCGLPWDERLLRFHEIRREIRMPAFGQMHRPLNADSTGRAKHY